MVMISLLIIVERLLDHLLLPKQGIHCFHTKKRKIDSIRSDDEDTQEIECKPFSMQIKGGNILFQDYDVYCYGNLIFHKDNCVRVNIDYSYKNGYKISYSSHFVDRNMYRVLQTKEFIFIIVYAYDKKRVKVFTVSRPLKIPALIKNSEYLATIISDLDDSEIIY
jgi:hypothetical protein